MAFLRFRVNVADVVADLQSYAPRAREAVRPVMRKSAARLLDRVNLIVPIATQYMHDHTTALVASDDLSYEVGWWAADFEGTVTETGQPRAFYPPYVEFGTSKMAAQPALRPAFADERPAFLEDLRVALIEAGGRR